MHDSYQKCRTIDAIKTFEKFYNLKVNKMDSNNEAERIIKQYSEEQLQCFLKVLFEKAEHEGRKRLKRECPFA